MGARAAAGSKEARIEPGDDHDRRDRLPSPSSRIPTGRTSPTASPGARGGPDDPEIAASYAEARAAGILNTDPAEAWGNAAIPGFGIGRPVRPPILDPAADALPPTP
jgi:hypothetical protein